MKKLSLAIVIAAFSISLVACTNSGTVNNSNNDSSINSSVDGETNTQNSNQNNIADNNQNNNEASAQNSNQNGNGANTQSNANTTEGISLDKAKEIALSHAGLNSNQVTFVKTQKDFDDGIQKYELEFYCNGKEYDYEVNAVNGQIIQYDYDMEYNYVPNNNQSNSQSNANNTAKISPDKAKEIALSHAGLTNGQVTFKRTELDFDDGIQKYDVEFYYNNREYSYEINANTGSILSYEQD